MMGVKLAPPGLSPGRYMVGHRPVFHVAPGMVHGMRATDGRQPSLRHGSRQHLLIR